MFPIEPGRYTFEKNTISGGPTKLSCILETDNIEVAYPWLTNPSGELYDLFVKGALDHLKNTRHLDSEMKFFYDFLTNHINDGDSFVISIHSQYDTCSSCRNYYAYVIAELEKMGKTVEIRVYSTSGVNGKKQLQDIITTQN